MNVVSTLFCQRWNNVNKHTSAQLSFSTKFQRWNNVGSLALNRRNSINVVLTLFCQRWNNVDECTSAQLWFSTKFQRWNNVDERWQSTLIQRWYVWRGFLRYEKIYPWGKFWRTRVVTGTKFVYHLLIVTWELRYSLKKLVHQNNAILIFKQEDETPAAQYYWG